MDERKFVNEQIALAGESGITGMKVWGYLYLAYIDLKAGNPQQALEDFTRALEIAGEVGLSEAPEEESLDLYFKGLAYLEMDYMNEAQRTADELQELTSRALNEKLERTYYLLLGMIEFKKGNYSKAMELAQQAVSLLPFQHMVGGSDTQALYIEPLALSYYMAGDLEKARREYERITSLTSGRLSFGDIYTKSFYMLGKIYEQQGNKEKALENYEKFLGLWKDADSDIPILIKAKAEYEQLLANEQS